MPPHTDAVLAPRPLAPPPMFPPSPVLSDALQGCHPHAAGLAIGDAAHWGAVPPGSAPQPVRRVGTGTADRDALADGLLDGGVTTGAMASTGVSGLPRCALLEARGLQVLRLDPRHAQRAPGRPQTERRDWQWRQRLHTSGLRAGACRPDAQVGGLRGDVRHRQRRRPAAAHPLQPRHKACAQRQRTRTQGVRASTGVTGMALRTAILAGERAPQRLATLRHPHGPHPEDDSATAWPGPWRAAPLCAFRHAVALEAFSHQQRIPCAQQSTAHRETCGETRAGQPLPPTARRHTKTTAPRCAARTPLSRLAGVDLTTLEGLADGTAVVLLRAIGIDMPRWPRVQYGCRWLGRCPQQHISGGKGRSRRVRPGAHRGTVARRRAARRLHHAQRAVGAVCRRRPARLGTPTAITAAAHTRARLVDHRRTHGSAYVHQGLEHDAAQDHERTGTTMATQAQALG